MHYTTPESKTLSEVNQGKRMKEQCYVLEDIDCGEAEAAHLFFLGSAFVGYDLDQKLQRVLARGDLQTPEFAVVQALFKLAKYINCECCGT